MKRVAAYIRVSTDKQSTDSQLVAIKDAIQRSGDVLVQVYEDHAISGGKCRKDRPALDSMLKDAGAGKFDKVIVWDITRLGRSLSDLIATLNELQRSNVDLQFLQNNLDTSTAGGRMLFSIFGAIGEFEKSLIRERVMALLSLEVELHPETLTVVVPEAERVTAVAVHEARAYGDAAVAHQDRDLVQRFR